MIRRTVSTPAGEHWLLIPQPEHARVAGLLADHWNGLTPGGRETTTQLLAAIHRHDDGWRGWERTPGVDARLGRPLDFTEMAVAETLAIWAASIDGVETWGPLAARTVSGHFCNLLRHSSGRGNHEESDRLLVAEFLQVQQAKQASWLAAWRKTDPALNTEQAACDSLEILQSFDALSLWLCCRRRSEPLTFRPRKSAEPVQLRPLAADLFEVSPWPFSTASLAIEVAAWSLPADNYRDGAAVAAARKSARIGWLLQPAEWSRGTEQELRSHPPNQCV